MNNLFDRYNHIARVIIALTLAILFFSCSFKNKDRVEVSQQRLLLILNFPIVQLDGRLLNLTDSIFITFYRNTIIYQLPMHYSIEDEEKILFQELRYSGFVFNRDDKFGYLFNSIKDSVGIRLLVDSMLKRKAFAFMDIYKVVKESNLISSFNNTKKNILSQIYSSKNVLDESYNDTTYLYFIKRNPLVDLPFSKKLDSAMNRSLIKARFLFNERYSELYKIRIPKREISIDIQYLKDKITRESKTFFDLFISKNSKE